MVLQSNPTMHRYVLLQVGERRPLKPFDIFFQDATGSFRREPSNLGSGIYVLEGGSKKVIPSDMDNLEKLPSALSQQLPPYRGRFNKTSSDMNVVDVRNQIVGAQRYNSMNNEELKDPRSNLTLVNSDNISFKPTGLHHQNEEGRKGNYASENEEHAMESFGLMNSEIEMPMHINDSVKQTLKKKLGFGESLSNDTNKQFLYDRPEKKSAEKLTQQQLR